MVHVVIPASRIHALLPPGSTQGSCHCVSCAAWRVLRTDTLRHEGSVPSSSITTGFTPKGALLDKDPPKEMQRTSNSLSSSCKGTRSLTDSGTPAELPPGCHEHPSKTADLRPRQGLEPPSPLPWRKGSLPRRGLVVVVYIVDSTIRQLPLFPPARKIKS